MIFTSHWEPVVKIVDCFHYFSLKTIWEVAVNQHQIFYHDYYSLFSFD